MSREIKKVSDPTPSPLISRFVRRAIRNDLSDSGLSGALIAVVLSLSPVFVSPAYGQQACSPSNEPGVAARTGSSLVNEARQTIVARRKGERGLDATTSATNRGAVITCGEVHEFLGDDGSPARRRAHAVAAESYSGGGATAVNSGLIDTQGRGARGMNVWEYGETATATATATNRGRIVTRGDVYDGTAHFGHAHLRTADGILAQSGPNAGDAVAVNERKSANDAQSGVIEVHGTGARGMWVWTVGTGEAKAINRGSITTHGDPFGGAGSYRSAAAGIAAQSSRGSATAINEAGATISTHGDGGPGLYASIYNNQGAATTRSARAENRGTITVSHDSGVEASAHVGSAVVVNTGDVTASGDAIGLLAIDGDSGDRGGGNEVNVEVRMTGGSVTAGTRDNPQTPEDEGRRGVGILAVASEAGSARVFVSGDSTTVTAYGEKTDSPDTPLEETGGFGIVIITSGGSYDEDSGRSNELVEVSGGATVTADVAVKTYGILNLYESELNGRVLLDDPHGGSNTHFTIRGGSVHGNVQFHAGDDILTITGDSRITGDVDFGEGTDTLVFNGPGTLDRIIEGEITGLENLFSTAAERAHLLPLFPAASDQRWTGVARIFAGTDLTVTITGYDDAGNKHGPVSLSMDEGATVHLNSHDIEHGNPSKGLSAGLGDGEGAWWLYLEAEPDNLGTELSDILPLAYIRTADGFLTAMHDRVVGDEDGEYFVGIFNPGSNMSQVSRLRVINPNPHDVVVNIIAKDDAPAQYHDDEDDGWVLAGPVSFDLGPHESRTVTAVELESGGEGLDGRLGDGQGKWKLRVFAEHPSIDDWRMPLYVMNLLASPTGHLSNLSTPTPEMVDVPVDCAGQYVSIPDAGLRNAIVDALGLNDSDRIPASALAGLRHLEAEAAGVEDLSGLECARNLQILILDDNQIADVTALVGLTALVELNLNDNQIADVSALAGLTALVELNLSGNQITDVSALAGLTALKDLDLEENQITDVTALAGLTALEELDLEDNQIADIAPLVANAGLGDGDRLTLAGNPLNAAAAGHIRTLIARGVSVVH